MSDIFHDYLVVALAGALGVLLCGGLLLVSRMLRPTVPERQKYDNYESGAEPVGGDWAHSHIRYYIYALLFLVFDVEIAFIVPWAIQVEEFGSFGLFEMFIFVAILVLGLAYAWRKGVLEWDS